MWTNEKIIKEIIRIAQADFYGISDKPGFKVAIQKLAGSIFKEVAGGSDIPANFVGSANLEDWVRLAHDLVVYRGGLVDIGQAQKQYDENYESFIEHATRYRIGLDNGNPLLLRAHIVKLYQRALNFSEDAKKTENPKAYYVETMRLIDKASNSFKKLNPLRYSAYCHLMDGYIKFVTGMMFRQTQYQDALEPQAFIDSARDAFQRAKEELTNKQKDAFYHLYAHKGFRCGLPFENVEKAIAYIDKNQKVLYKRDTAAIDFDHLKQANQ